MKDTYGSGTNVVVIIITLVIACVVIGGVVLFFAMSYDDNSTQSSGNIIIIDGKQYAYIDGQYVQIMNTPTQTVTPTVTPTPTVVPNQTVSNVTQNQTIPIVTPTPTENTEKNNLVIHVMDVGQADAILMSKDGDAVLVDAGLSMKEQDSGKSEMKNHLKTIDDLDWLLTTHQDYDHIGQVVDVMNLVDVKKFYDNGNSHTSKTYENMIQKVLDDNIAYEIVKVGNDISTWDDVSVKVVSSKATNGKDINDDSVVLLVKYGNTEMLLTGDISEEVEDNINVGDIDILKVAHHGSSSSSSKDFLSKVKPELNVISVGENSYGHPTSDALARLGIYGDIYRTDEYGCVVIDISESGYTVHKCTV